MEKYNMQLTLEEHFQAFSNEYEQVREVYSLWIILKKDISEKLNNVSRTFPYYSKHDATHSKTIITNIELFLGEERIKELSATDTFMLLVCAYLHDYGMALDLEEILAILNDPNNELRDFIKQNYNNDDSAERILNYYEKKESDGDLKAFYQSIILILENYNRPKHWAGVEKIKDDYNHIFLGRIKPRFVKCIIEICKTHGKDICEISALSRFSKGMFADVFHPRFIAAMIRLGDLLDLDNNRFSREFMNAIRKENNNIPELSKIHYLKHESIVHFYIGPTHIDIEASCEGKYALLVAKELYEWLDWLENDCNYYKKEWDMIAQRNFGAAPRIRDKKIWVKGIEYQHFIYNLKMELPSDKIFNLLSGSNVYENKYVAFREIIQNAVDATLLQMWKDYYNSPSIEQQGKESSKTFSVWRLKDKCDDDYSIHIDVIEDLRDDSIYVEVIDSGIGIDDNDLEYMCRIGENNIANPKRHEFINQMPDWLLPSGIFGIGLQSAFQLTDEVEFFTKKANRTPRHVRFSSYSSNQGKFEVSKCPDNYDEYKEQFNKLSTQGTLVRIKINSQSYRHFGDFDYYDLEFDQVDIGTHAIWVEIINQIKLYLNTNKINYFPIYLFEYIINKDGSKEYGLNKKPVKKVISDLEIYRSLKCDNIIRTELKGTGCILRFWDQSRNIHLRIDIPKCKIINASEKIYSINCLNNSFVIQYKYNNIGDYRQLFGITYDDPFSKIYELNNNIIKCTVEILDKNPEKYLNIDRNVLKYGKIKYSDILEMEKIVFTELCNNMINNGAHQLLLSNEYISIISILFSRFVDEKNNLLFQNTFNKKLSQCNILIENDFDSKNMINLVDFINCNNKICVSADCNLDDTSLFENIEECKNSNVVGLKFLYEHFPKHFFIPCNIKMQKYNNKIHIMYYCKIRNESSIEISVEDFNCWKLDCKLLSTNLEASFIRKVFKPIEPYRELFVNRIPKTFHLSSLFSNILDENITSYIISPFDSPSIKKLLDCRNCDVDKLDGCINDLLNCFESNLYFEKCVKFVQKNNLDSFSETEIREAYKKFIKDTATILNKFE